MRGVDCAATNPGRISEATANILKVNLFIRLFPFYSVTIVGYFESHSARQPTGRLGFMLISRLYTMVAWLSNSVHREEPTMIIVNAADKSIRIIMAILLYEHDHEHAIYALAYLPVSCGVNPSWPFSCRCKRVSRAQVRLSWSRTCTCNRPNGSVSISIASPS